MFSSHARSARSRILAFPDCPKACSPQGRGCGLCQPGRSEHSSLLVHLPLPCSPPPASSLSGHFSLLLRTLVQSQTAAFWPGDWAPAVSPAPSARASQASRIHQGSPRQDRAEGVVTSLALPLSQLCGQRQFPPSFSSCSSSTKRDHNNS